MGEVRSDGWDGKIALEDPTLSSVAWISRIRLASERHPWEPEFRALASLIAPRQHAEECW